MKRMGLLCLGICLMAVLISACAQELDIIEDTTPPAAITELKAVSDTGKITLSWVNPADADFYGAKIYTGVEENGTVNYDKGIILNRDEQEYTVTGLKDDGIYTFRASAVDACFNESSYVTSEQVVFKEKIVEKKNNKFVCPECKKEYDKDEDAAKCHGAATLYSVKITAGTYKVYHMLQTLDFINYHLVSAEDNKKLEENSTIDNVKKDFTGFTAKSITYNKSELYVYYNRKPITYTFSSGNQGGFINENTTGTLFGRFGTSNTRTSSGYYGTIVPAIDKPKAEGYGFSKWDSNIPETFGSENKTFTAEWTSIASCVGSGIGNGTVYSTSDYVMLSKDSVKTSMGKAEIYPFLMTKTEVTYNKWKEVINWAKTNGYSCDISFDDIGAAGSFTTSTSEYKDWYQDGKEYTENVNEEKEYDDEKFGEACDPSRGSSGEITRTVHVNLQTGKRYYKEGDQKFYFERGDSFSINSEIIDFSGYVEIKKSGNSDPIFYINPKYIRPEYDELNYDRDEYNNKYSNGTPGYIDLSTVENEYIKQLQLSQGTPSFDTNQFDTYITDNGYNLYIKKDTQSNYSGTDLIFFKDGSGKYLKLTGSEYKLDTIAPFIFYKEYGGVGRKQYVITKTSVPSEINISELVVYDENVSGERKFYLIDKNDGNKTVYGNKIVNSNWYTFTMRNSTVYFAPKKGVEQIGTGGMVDRNPSSYGNDPVTRINWLMAAMWCNAASEMEGLTPVYYKPGTTDFTDTSKVIRDAEFKYQKNGVLYYCTSDFANAVINPAAKGYRLPTEAEWEYAARGGDQNASAWNYTYAGSNNFNDIAWCYENSGNNTHQVGQKFSNTAGLYDMSGNVFEFCWGSLLPADNYYFISVYVRGGSWLDPENFQRVDARNAHYVSAMGNGNSATDSSSGKKYYAAQYNVGFRVVRSVTQ